MNRRERRHRGLSLLVGICAGIVVGTVHALVSHVMTRDEPPVAIVHPLTRHATETDVGAR